jgi:hypothetical protein
MRERYFAVLMPYPVCFSMVHYSKRVDIPFASMTVTHLIVDYFYWHFLLLLNYYIFLNNST